MVSAKADTCPSINSTGLHVLRRRVGLVNRQKIVLHLGDLIAHPFKRFFKV
jgi:hypothetical protein